MPQEAADHYQTPKSKPPHNIAATCFIAFVIFIYRKQSGSVYWTSETHVISPA
jgi:hypothetical protein